MNSQSRCWRSICTTYNAYSSASSSRDRTHAPSAFSANADSGATMSPPHTWMAGYSRLTSIVPVCGFNATGSSGSELNPWKNAIECSNQRPTWFQRRPYCDRRGYRAPASRTVSPDAAVGGLQADPAVREDRHAARRQPRRVDRLDRMSLAGDGDASGRHGQQFVRRHRQIVARRKAIGRRQDVGLPPAHELLAGFDRDRAARERERQAPDRERRTLRRAIPERHVRVLRRLVDACPRAHRTHRPPRRPRWISQAGSTRSSPSAITRSSSFGAVCGYTRMAASAYPRYVNRCAVASAGAGHRHEDDDRENREKPGHHQFRRKACTVKRSPPSGTL